MKKQIDLKEKLILMVAVICLAGLLYLLYDDSLLVDTLSDNSGDAIGKVVPLANDVRYKRNQEFQWLTVRKSRNISWGDGVFTGKNSQARVELKNGSLVTLQENSLIVFTPNKKELTLDLKFGTVKSQIAENQNLKIEVDGETLNLAGKDAVVEIDKKAGDNVAVKVVTGEINIVDKTKNIKRVVAGERTSVTTKPTPQPTPKPKPTATPTPTPTPIPTPTPVPLPDTALIEWQQPEQKAVYTVKTDIDGNPIEKARIELQWKANDPRLKIKGYNIEMAKESAFKNPIIKKTLTAPTVKYDFGKAGKYFARLQVVLDDSQESKETIETPWSEIRELEVKFLETPALEAPKIAKSNLSINGDEQKSTDIEWSPINGAEKYRVDFSRGEDFKEVAESEDVAENRLNFRPSQAGKIFYRVRALTKTGKLGQASQIGSIETKLSTPVLEKIPSASILGQNPNDPPAEVDLKMAWSKIPISKGYEVQVGTSEDFKDPVVLNTPSSKGNLKINNPGTYFVRVRALNNLAEPLSPFSNVEKFVYKYRIPIVRPILKEPMNNVTLFFQGNDMTFWMVWQPVKTATRYLVELSDSEEFKNPMLSARVETNRYLIRQTLPQGKLYWRVKAENEERESQWSATRSITVLSARKAEGN